MLTSEQGLEKSHNNYTKKQGLINEFPFYFILFFLGGGFEWRGGWMGGGANFIIKCSYRSRSRIPNRIVTRLKLKNTLPVAR